MIRRLLLPAFVVAAASAAAQGDGILSVKVADAECPNGTVRLLGPVESVEIAVSAPDPSRPGVALVEAGEQGTTFVHRQQAEWEWTISAGRAQATAPGTVRWFPPAEGGLTTFRVALVQADSVDDGEANRAAASAEFGLVAPAPFDRNGDGRIGQGVVGIYPSENSESAPGVVSRNRRTYAPPAGFYRLDDQTAGLEVAPGVTLGELNPEVLTVEGDRYVAMHADLGAFVAAVDAVLVEKGVPAGSVRVLRGYVSPNDRARLQRMGIALAEFSRFQYGDCLALIVDRNGDFRMDDLNGDNTVDRADAAVLALDVETAQSRIGRQGGIGVCRAFEGPNHIGTPYVQTDLRGWSVKWEE